MDKITELNGLSVATPEAILEYNFTVVAEVSGKIVLGLVAIAIFDYIYQRWHHEKKTDDDPKKREIKEETKQTEGDRSLKQEFARFSEKCQMPE
ncbi:MAG: hypothetical protein Ct9H300mP28_25460 [Pseudomonadota bacterium]|nr:MAG: hypothetical protein Ct9H300mP28_25460 [Pseudomonadota bacterium]